MPQHPLLNEHPQPHFLQLLDSDTVLINLLVFTSFLSTHYTLGTTRDKFDVVPGLKAVNERTQVM